MTALLKVRNLSTKLATPRGLVTPVDNLSFDLEDGRTLALVGESGSGKTIACLSILGLLPANGRRVAGKILFDDRDLMSLTDREMETVRGRELGMILQDAMTSLNPLFTVGQQITEVFQRHYGIRDKSELRRRSIEALESVGISAAHDRIHSYPFQLSGGMRQRISIAINIACSPRLLICDEPTTALDATVQLQVLALLQKVCREKKMAMIFITHDLHLARRVADEVAVMYAGRIVEQGSVADIFSRPAHPYTQGLLDAIPSLTARLSRLQSIPGYAPSLLSIGKDCRFAPRCSKRYERCASYPDWYETRDARRRVACWRAGESE